MFGVAEQAVETALKLNEIEQVFRKMIPSAEGAQEAIDGIRKVAENSDFGFEGLEKTAGVLLRMKVPGDQVVDTMGAIVNAVGNIEGTQQDIDAVAMAIGRMNVSGQVTQRQLKALADAFPDTYKILREQLGLTQDEIMNIKDQNLEGAEVANALLKGMFESTAVGTENAADETAQQLKNLNDNVTKLYESLGKELLPLIKPAIDGINNALKDTDKIAQAVVFTIQTAIGLMSDLLNKLPTVSGALGAMAKAAAALDSLDPTGALGFGEIAKGLNAAGYLTSVGPGGAPAVPRPPGFVGPPAPPSGSGSGTGGTPDFNLAGPAQDLDDLGQAISDAERELEGMAKDNAEYAVETEKVTKTVKAHGEAVQQTSKAVVQTADDLDVYNDSVMNAVAGHNELDGQTREVAIRFSNLQGAIDGLKFSFTVGAGVIDGLFPKLKGAGDLYDKMFKQAFQLFEGGFGPGVLSSYHSLIAQNESDLRLLAFMEATGQGVQDMGTTMGQGADKMATAFDDLLASFTHHADATNRVADSVQAVADTAMVSAHESLSGAMAGAAAVNSGLEQLGVGLASYGTMAASGTLPGGLPGGNPFSGMGTHISETGGYSGGPTHDSITNPFASGTPWGGGQHGFAPGGNNGNWGGGITIGFDNNGFSQFLRVMNSSWAGQNAVGQRT